jgi:hypothetical protein
MVGDEVAADGQWHSLDGRGREVGRMKMYLKRTPWGYEVWCNGVQVAAGVGLDPAAFRDDVEWVCRCEPPIICC